MISSVWIEEKLAKKETLNEETFETLFFEWKKLTILRRRVKIRVKLMMIVD